MNSSRSNEINNTSKKQQMEQLRKDIGEKLLAISEKDKAIRQLLVSPYFHMTERLLVAYRSIMHTERSIRHNLTRRCKKLGITMADIVEIDEQHNHSRVTEIGLELARANANANIMKHMRKCLRRVKNDYTDPKRMLMYNVLYDRYFTQLCYTPYQLQIRATEKLMCAQSAEEAQGIAPISKATYYRYLKQAVERYAIQLFGAPDSNHELLLRLAMEVQELNRLPLITDEQNVFGLDLQSSTSAHTDIEQHACSEVSENVWRETFF